MATGKDEKILTVKETRERKSNWNRTGRGRTRGRSGDAAKKLFEGEGKIAYEAFPKSLPKTRSLLSCLKLPQKLVLPIAMP